MSQNVTILGHWNSRKAKSPPSLSWGEERTKILLLACCYQEDNGGHLQMAGASLPHCRKHRPGNVVSGVQIDAHHHVPNLRGEALHRAIRDVGTGSEHQDIDFAQALARGLRQVSHLGCV